MIKILLSIITLCYFFNIVYANEKIKVSSPPSIWVQQQGNTLKGPIIDLLNEIFSEYNLSIESEILPWARAVSHMKSGLLDMIPVIFYTDDRSKFMKFTLPYTQVQTSVFVPKGKKFSFKTLNDLKGRRGLIMRDDSISSEFKKFLPVLTLTRIVQYKDILKMLIDNRADYAVAAKFGFIIESKKLGLENEIEALPMPISYRNLHFAFSKKSQFVKYVTIINKKLKKMKADGSLKKMIDKTICLAAGCKSEY